MWEESAPIRSEQVWEESDLIEQAYEKKVTRFGVSKRVGRK
jgi:hypothetical protein